MAAIESGKYSIITTDQCIASAKILLKTETTDDDIFFEKLVNDAVKKLNCRENYVKKIIQLRVADNKSKLPNGYKQFLGLWWNNTAINEDCDPMIYVDLPFLNSCGCSTTDGTTNYRGYFEIENGWIHYHIDMTGITEVKFAYWGLNTDENGLMVVMEDYEDAIMYYLCWMYSLQNPNLYPQYMQETFHQNWLAQKNRLKGLSFKYRSESMKLQTMEWANSMLSDKNY